MMSQKKVQYQGHEDFRRDEQTKLPSNRSFGFVFVAFFTLIGLLPMAFGHSWRPWAIGVAGVFLLLTLVCPKVLTPLNKIWMAFGNLLHFIVSPIVLGLLFFCGVVPTGLLLRILGKDPLRRKSLPPTGTQSYWIPKQDEPSSMERMF